MDGSTDAHLILAKIKDGIGTKGASRGEETSAIVRRGIAAINEHVAEKTLTILDDP